MLIIAWPKDKIKEARRNYSQALIYLNDGNLKQAAAYFQRAYKNEPDNYNYLWQLAKTEVRLEKYRKAVKRYDQLIKKIPHIFLPYIEQGEVYEFLGNPEKAKTLYRKAIEINKNAGQAYLNLSSVLLGQGNRLEARFVLEEGLRNNPKNTELKKALERIK